MTGSRCALGCSIAHRLASPASSTARKRVLVDSGFHPVARIEPAGAALHHLPTTSPRRCSPIAAGHLWRLRRFRQPSADEQCELAAVARVEDGLARRRGCHLVARLLLGRRKSEAAQVVLDDTLAELLDGTFQVAFGPGHFTARVVQSVGLES